MYVYKNLIDNTNMAIKVLLIIKNILVRMHSLNIFSDLLSNKTTDLKINFYL